VPVAIKDILATRGRVTTCASKMLETFVPPYNAHVVDRLEASDAVVLGKTNMDEFAMGSSNENSAFAVTRNPWDTERIPGGSSGGSAAAVAAGMAPVSLGSDTGGSIRLPAALCGVVGLKPTYGRVSRYGLVAFASSLDQIGPLASTVGDAAELAGVIFGHDPRDSTSVERPVPDYLAEMRDGAKGLRIGVPKEYFGPGLEPDVASAVRAALDFYQDYGCEVIDISLPHAEYAVAAYYLVATAEASSNLARYDGVQYGYRAPGSDQGDLVSMYNATRARGFGPEVKRRIMLGTYALSAGYYDAYYLKALKVRGLIRGDFLRAFEKVDAIVSPTSPTVAFKVGEKVEDPLAMYLTDIYTISANLAGVCGISIPCGMSGQGLPIGLQIMGDYFEESKLFRLARAFEESHDYHTKRPEL
jgi:aspartyl-tRNA(Asn)/glutamyl-tRNA(Gln) amidotransferase subunit A